MANIKLAQQIASDIAKPARIFFETDEGKTYSTAMSPKRAPAVVAALVAAGIPAAVCEPTEFGTSHGGLVSVELL